MMRWLPWLIVAALLAALGAALWRPEAVARRLGLDERIGEAKRQRWQADMRGQYARLDRSVPAGALLFLGDSHVQGFNAAQVGSCTASFGIGGETARELAARVTELKSLDRAAAIMVQIGTNDVLRDEDDRLADSYYRLLAALPADRPVLLSSLPRMVPGSDHAFQVVRGSGVARAACARRPNCHFVDLAAAMDDPAALLEADGIHLNPAGYAVWARVLREALAKAGVADKSCAG